MRLDWVVTVLQVGWLWSVTSKQSFLKPHVYNTVADHSTTKRKGNVLCCRDNFHILMYIIETKRLRYSLILDCKL